jgi:proteasome lid subunit RPN8/RPN11
MITIEFLPLQQIKDHAVRIFPDECCGFFYGTESADGVRLLTGMREVENSKEGDKKRRFQISATDYMKAERWAEETGQLLLGIYHSHPNHPAIPSEHDRIAAQPYFSYIIVSVMHGTVDTIYSWRLNEQNQFEPENITNLSFTKI